MLLFVCAVVCMHLPTYVCMEEEDTHTHTHTHTNTHTCARARTGVSGGGDKLVRMYKLMRMYKSLGCITNMRSSSYDRHPPHHKNTCSSSYDMHPPHDANVQEP